MRNLRNKGKMFTAVVAAGAMLASAFAAGPAMAADGTCVAASAAEFDGCISQKATNIKVTGVNKFNEGKGLLNFGLTSFDSYGTPTHYDLAAKGYDAQHPLTITGVGDQAILHNVTFTVPQGTTLTMNGSVVLDDVNLSGLNLLGLIGITGLVSAPGIPAGIEVAGGTLNLEDNARVASGANGAVKQQRAIDVTSNNSTVNLKSTGTYARPDNIGLDIDVNVPLVGDLLKPILGLLNFKRTVAYPTVWGRDAAIYSEPSVTNATINIYDGTYSNQKDKHSLSGNYLNAAVSSSATVNVIGTGSVKISNTKIGNAINSDYTGNNTTGTLNLDNPNAILDPATEEDTDAQAAATDSYALELRGSATANIVNGSVNDTLPAHIKDGVAKVIETEKNSRVNILAASQGAVKIANLQYYIAQTAKNGAAFSAQVNANAALDDENKDAYELWSSGAESKSDDSLSQLVELVAKESAGSDPAAAKLSQSTYAAGRISAAYLEDVSASGRAVYGRHEIITTSSSPFGAVNGTDKGEVVLYGLPWVGQYSTGGTAPEQSSKLFAGWYTSQQAFNAEDAIQGSTAAAGEKHHNWTPSAENFDGTFGKKVVVSTNKYSGTLYPHFVEEDTIKVTGVQVAKSPVAGRYNLRFISGMDSYNFKNAKFKIVYNGKPLTTITTTNVYDYVIVNGSNETFAGSPFHDLYSTDLLGSQGNARYVTTAILKNVPTGTTLEVTPSWTTLDGVQVTGSAFNITLNADGTVTRS